MYRGRELTLMLGHAKKLTEREVRAALEVEFERLVRDVDVRAVTSQVNDTNAAEVRLDLRIEVQRGS